MAATRRLAAIFAADVAGYSRLTGADEEGTKTIGDGMLIEFASVVESDLYLIAWI